MGNTGMIGTWMLLLAQRSGWKILETSLILVAALLVGAAIIALVERWRKRSGSEGLTSGDQLSHFRNLYEEGSISKEEFERIRARLAGQMRDELNLTGAANPTAKQGRAADERVQPEPRTDDGPRPPEPPANGIHPG
jgi:uncharacterized membrane protein